MEYIIIIKYWLSFYIQLYFYTFPLVICVIWFWLTYVDRVHIRHTFNNIGNKFKKTFGSKFMIKYVYNQLNTFSEIIAGFSDALIDRKPSINIEYLKDNCSQTEIFSCNKNTQTQILLYNSIETNTDDFLNEKIVIDDLNNNCAETKSQIIKEHKNIETKPIEEEKKIDIKQLFKSKKDDKIELNTELIDCDIKQDEKTTKKNKKIFIRKKFEKK